MKNNKLTTIGTITLAGAVLLSSPLTAAYATNEFCEQETHAWEDVDHDGLCDICGGGLMDLPAGADLGDSLGKGRTEGDYIPNIEPETDENNLPDLPSGADILDSLLKGRKEGDYIPSIEPKAQAKAMAYSVLKEYPYETDSSGQHDDSTHDWEDLDHDQVCDLCGGEGLADMPLPTPDDAIGKECPSIIWSDHYDEGNGFCRCGMDIKYAGVSHLFEDDNLDWLCDVCNYAYDPFGDSLGKGKHPTVGGDHVPDIGTESTESTESTEETESSEIPSTEETESTETESTETPSTEETESTETESTETPSTEETESTETESTEEPSIEETESTETESTEEPSTEETESTETESTEEPSTEETSTEETSEETSTEETSTEETESTEETSTETGKVDPDDPNGDTQLTWTESTETESTEEPSTITTEEPSTITTEEPSTTTEEGKTESNETIETSDTQNKNYGMYFLISALGCSLPVFKKFFIK